MLPCPLAPSRAPGPRFQRELPSARARRPLRGSGLPAHRPHWRPWRPRLPRPASERSLESLVVSLVSAKSPGRRPKRTEGGCTRPVGARLGLAGEGWRRQAGTERQARERPSNFLALTFPPRSPGWGSPPPDRFLSSRPITFRTTTSMPRSTVRSVSPARPTPAPAIAFYARLFANARVAPPPPPPPPPLRPQHSEGAGPGSRRTVSHGPSLPRAGKREQSQ